MVCAIHVLVPPKKVRRGAQDFEEAVLGAGWQQVNCPGRSVHFLRYGFDGEPSMS